MVPLTGGQVNLELQEAGQPSAPASDPVCGLTKDELLQYMDNPGWRKARWISFSLFWIAWLAMLFGSIAIVMTTSDCPPKN